MSYSKRARKFYRFCKLFMQFTDEKIIEETQYLHPIVRKRILKHIARKRGR